MKKSLLALAVVAVAASANAATVYDKDGTSLYLDGRVQSVFYNGNHKNSAAEYDSTIKNTARFGIGGKTQITDWVAGYGYAQWDMDSTGSGSGTTARDQFVGADFGDFGKLQAGKYRDSSYYVENLTDHYEDAAGTVQGAYNGARRGGQITYIYDNYGFHGQAGIQTAQDKAKMFGADNPLEVGDGFAVDSGFNAALGYKTGDVLFGPLDFRVGYSYLKGQQNNDLTTAKSVYAKKLDDGTYESNVHDSFTNGNAFNKFKHANVGVAWGNLNSGLYLAAIYDYAKLTDFAKDPAKLEGLDNELTNKGYELAVGYAFDNGLSALLGYEHSFIKYRPVAGGDDVKIKYRRIPLLINYKANANFNVWTEFGFNAGSDHQWSNENERSVAHRWDKTVWSIGARYTF
jgi:predicted porin